MKKMNLNSKVHSKEKKDWTNKKARGDFSLMN